MHQPLFPSLRFYQLIQLSTTDCQYVVLTCAHLQLQIASGQAQTVSGAQTTEPLLRLPYLPQTSTAQISSRQYLVKSKKSMGRLKRSVLIYMVRFWSTCYVPLHSSVLNTSIIYTSPPRAWIPGIVSYFQQYDCIVMCSKTMYVQVTHTMRILPSSNRTTLR